MGDVALVDALARLQLEAQRCGLTIVLLDAPDDLVELIDLAGLAEVLPLVLQRQPEEREQRRRVEEERELGDPAA